MKYELALPVPGCPRRPHGSSHSAALPRIQVSNSWASCQASGSQANLFTLGSDPRRLQPPLLEMTGSLGRRELEDTEASGWFYPMSDKLNNKWARPLRSYYSGLPPPTPFSVSLVTPTLFLGLILLHTLSVALLKNPQAWRLGMQLRW